MFLNVVLEGCDPLGRDLVDILVALTLDLSTRLADGVSLAVGVRNSCDSVVGWVTPAPRSP